MTKPAEWRAQSGGKRVDQSEIGSTSLKKLKCFIVSSAFLNSMKIRPKIRWPCGKYGRQ